MAVLNSNILSRAWLSGSNMFQQRIPNPAINSYANVVSNLFAPMNNDLFNEFCGLLNGLNATYVDIKRWQHGLRVLKKPAAEWGNTERHVAVKFLQAHAGKWDDETLLKVEKPEFVEWFYSVGEPRRYEFSWSKQEIARTFAADGYGYNDLLSATITQMLNSAEYDEMQIMLQMFAEADKRVDNGLYRYNLSAAPTDKATAEELMIGVRAMASKMEIAPTMNYNHIPVPVVEDASTLVFWCTPEVDAVLDVSLLATVFNLDKADIKYRKIVIPEFPIPNVYAALTSEDFIYYRDFMTGLEPPFFNPGNRTLKYYYWANGMIGFNPAANCVLFTTDTGTSLPTVTVAPTGMSFVETAVNVEAGGEVQLALQLEGTVTGTNPDGLIAVEPDAATFTVSTTVPGLELNSKTYVDAYGVLHVQKGGVKAGNTITVTAKSAYINPSGSTTAYTATATATIVAAANGGAKADKVDTDPYIVYTDVPDGTDNDAPQPEEPKES